MILNKVEHTLLEHDILPKTSVLIGLSGGADSIALTHILFRLSKKYNFKVFTAHVNHGLRGITANSDEQFSQLFSKNLGIKCFSLSADVRKKASEEKISEELAGRAVRYDFFEKIIKEYGISSIATAHHKNDNVETILMNFIRGSSLRGLCGIPFKRGNIIRPLLDVTKKEILQYCYDNNLEFVTDETNAETIYTRNRIRNNLIPEIIADYNPNFINTVIRNSELINIENDFISNMTEKYYNSIVTDNKVSVAKLMELHDALVLRIIKKMIDCISGTENVSFKIINSVFTLLKKNKTGSKIDIIRDSYARIEYGYLIIDKKKQNDSNFEYELHLGHNYIAELNYTIVLEIADTYDNNDSEYFSIPLQSSIRLRNRRVGDYFYPSGMQGKKKIKDYMINQKIPQEKRSTIGILTINNDIAWIIGYRRDNRFKFDKKGIKISILY